MHNLTSHMTKNHVKGFKENESLANAGGFLKPFQILHQRLPWLVHLVSFGQVPILSIQPSEVK